jgi:hypothetical protein
MKIYNLTIPVFLAFFSTNTPFTNLTTSSESLDNVTIEMVETPEIAAIGKKKGLLTGEQDFTSCNTCAQCNESCYNSEGACIGAFIEITELYCPFESPQGVLSFPGNSQYICSLTQTGPYTWYLEFNAVAYSCSLPDIPYKFDIPMQYTYVCSWTGSGTIFGSVNFIIC